MKRDHILPPSNYVFSKDRRGFITGYTRRLKLSSFEKMKCRFATFSGINNFARMSTMFGKFKFQPIETGYVRFPSPPFSPFFPCALF